VYVPQHFSETERAHLLAVMRRHGFATVVSVIDGEPFASHVPVRVEERDDGGLRIEGHVAAVNAHAHAFERGVRALVIFHGPHTYVSPTLYRSAGRVPTWNYIAVHASGPTSAITGLEAKGDVLRRLIDDYEPSFAATFAAFEPRHRDGLLRAITGFELVVDRLQGKFKLGQNRLADNLPAMRTEHETGDADRRELAEWMQRLGHWPCDAR
jgi:transcriptional regulator